MMKKYLQKKTKHYWLSDILYDRIITEYQKVTNFLDNTPNQQTKFRTKNWVEIKDDSRGTCNANSQIKFKSLILRLCLYDYSNGYIIVSGTIKHLEVYGNILEMNNF